MEESHQAAMREREAGARDGGGDVGTEKALALCREWLSKHGVQE